MYQLQPITQKEAFRFIKDHHRTHEAPAGWLFGIAVNDGKRVVGVVVVGRPVSRVLDNGYTAEVLRCCVMENLPRVIGSDGRKHAPSVSSMLYGAAVRAARAMGYKRIITYLLKSEPGVSLRAAGWQFLYDTKGGSWDCPSRPRVDTHPIEQKQLWEAI